MDVYIEYLDNKKEKIFHKVGEMSPVDAKAFLEMVREFGYKPEGSFYFYNYFSAYIERDGLVIAVRSVKE